MKIDYKLIGKRIQNRRKEMGYSQLDFAEKIERSTTFVSYIENGTRSMTINTLIQIANVLDVSSDYLLADYIDKNQNKFIDTGKNKISIFPDNPESVAKYIVDCGMKIKEQFETEFGYVFVAVR